MSQQSETKSEIQVVAVEIWWRYETCENPFTVYLKNQSDIWAFYCEGVWYVDKDKVHDLVRPL